MAAPLKGDGGSFAELRLTGSATTTTGVLIATYQPAGGNDGASRARVEESNG
jgi:hypothetical protein